MKVIFDLVKNGTRVVYPDDKNLFSNVVVREDLNPQRIIADYVGEKLIEKYDPTLYPKYRKTLTGSEVIKLLGIQGYSTITDAANTGDGVALYFLEIARELNKEQKPIRVDHPDYVAAIDHFEAQGYITTELHNKMLQGAPI